MDLPSIEMKQATESMSFSYPICVIPAISCEMKRKHFRLNYRKHFAFIDRDRRMEINPRYFSVICDYLTKNARYSERIELRA